MSHRTNLTFVSILIALAIAANGVGYAQSNNSDGNDKSKPLAPNTPPLLQPLGPTPSGPTPGSPSLLPAPVYPLGSTAKQDSVTQRSRPEFQPIGLELGTVASKIGLIGSSTEAGKSSKLSSFMMFPKLEFSASYDSNIFRSKAETSDKILIVSPSLSIQSDWATHALEFYGAADVARYDKTTSEDYQDVHGRISGRADLFDNFSLTTSILYGQRHQPRGELIDPGDTSEATVINRGQLRAGAELELATVTLSANLESETRDFVSTGAVDNDDLDRDEHTVTARASLEVDTGTSIFVQPRYNRRIYDRKVDASGFEQDSHGFEVLGGFRWDASGVTFAEFGLGYLWQNFDESRFAMIEGATASAQVLWNFSDLWTWTFGLARTVSETSDQDLSGVLNTRFNSQLDYEFLYNTIVSLRLEYSDEDYKSSSRADERTVGSFEIKHLFNKYLFTSLDVRHERLSSNRDDEDYKVTSGMIRLGTQY